MAEHASRFYVSDLEPIQNLAQGSIQLEKSRSPKDAERVLAAPVWWLREKDRDSLRQALSTFISEILIPEQFPEITIPQGADLEEIKLLVGKYARRQEDLEEGCEEFREALFRELERRHGPLPDEIRQRITAIDSIEDLTLLSLRAGSISSLADL